MATSQPRSFVQKLQNVIGVILLMNLMSVSVIKGLSNIVSLNCDSNGGSLLFGKPSESKLLTDFCNNDPITLTFKNNGKVAKSAFPLEVKFYLSTYAPWVSASEIAGSSLVVELTPDSPVKIEDQQTRGKVVIDLPKIPVTLPDICGKVSIVAVIKPFPNYPSFLSQTRITGMVECAQPDVDLTFSVNGTRKALITPGKKVIITGGKIEVMNNGTADLPETQVYDSPDILAFAVPPRYFPNNTCLLLNQGNVSTDYVIKELCKKGTKLPGLEMALMNEAKTASIVIPSNGLTEISMINLEIPQTFPCDPTGMGIVVLVINPFNKIKETNRSNNILCLPAQSVCEVENEIEDDSDEDSEDSRIMDNVVCEVIPDEDISSSDAVLLGLGYNSTAYKFEDKGFRKLSFGSTKGRAVYKRYNQAKELSAKMMALDRCKVFSETMDIYSENERNNSLIATFGKIVDSIYKDLSEMQTSTFTQQVETEHQKFLLLFDILGDLVDYSMEPKGGIRTVVINAASIGVYVLNKLYTDMTTRFGGTWEYGPYGHGRMPGNMPGGMPGGMYGNMPGGMPGNMPGRMPGNMPGGMFGMPGEMPESGNRNNYKRNEEYSNYDDYGNDNYVNDYGDYDDMYGGSGYDSELYDDVYDNGGSRDYTTPYPRNGGSGDYNRPYPRDDGSGDYNRPYTNFDGSGDTTWSNAGGQQGGGPNGYRPNNGEYGSGNYGNYGNHGTAGQGNYGKHGYAGQGKYGNHGSAGYGNMHGMNGRPMHSGIHEQLMNSPMGKKIKPLLKFMKRLYYHLKFAGNDGNTMFRFIPDSLYSKLLNASKIMTGPCLISRPLEIAFAERKVNMSIFENLPPKVIMAMGMERFDEVYIGPDMIHRLIMKLLTGDKDLAISLLQFVETDLYNAVNNVLIDEPNYQSELKPMLLLSMEYIGIIKNNIESGLGFFKTLISLMQFSPEEFDLLRGHGGSEPNEEDMCFRASLQSLVPNDGATKKRKENDDLLFQSPLDLMFIDDDERDTGMTYWAIKNNAIYCGKRSFLFGLVFWDIIATCDCPKSTKYYKYDGNREDHGGMNSHRGRGNNEHHNGYGGNRHIKWPGNSGGAGQGGYPSYSGQEGYPGYSGQGGYPGNSGRRI